MMRVDTILVIFKTDHGYLKPEIMDLIPYKGGHWLAYGTAVSGDGLSGKRPHRIIRVPEEDIGPGPAGVDHLLKTQLPERVLAGSAEGYEAEDNPPLLFHGRRGPPA